MLGISPATAEAQRMARSAAQEAGFMMIPWSDTVIKKCVQNDFPDSMILSFTAETQSTQRLRFEMFLCDLCG
jgi:hypothetical protein